MIRRIRDLLYDQGFTIVGARNRLQELAHADKHAHDSGQIADGVQTMADEPGQPLGDGFVTPPLPLDWMTLRKELEEIRTLLF